MVSTRPFVFKSSSPSTKPLVTLPSAPIKSGITVSFMFHIFSVLLQGLGTYLSFRFPSVLLCGQLERQSPLFSRISFSFVYCLLLDQVVCPRQRVSSDLQDSPKYLLSGWFQIFFQINFDCYHCHFPVPPTFLFSFKVSVFVKFLVFLLCSKQALYDKFVCPY